MSKFLIHFQDQLTATSNPDPLLTYLTFEDDRFEVHQTKKSQLIADLVGMRFEMMTNVSMHGITHKQTQLPIFVSELVDA